MAIHEVTNWRFPSGGVPQVGQRSLSDALSFAAKFPNMAGILWAFLQISIEKGFGIFRSTCISHYDLMLLWASVFTRLITQLATGPPLRSENEVRQHTVAKNSKTKSKKDKTASQLNKT